MDQAERERIASVTYQMLVQVDLEVAELYSGIREQQGLEVSCKGPGCDGCCHDVVIVALGEVLILRIAYEGLDEETRIAVDAGYELWRRGHVPQHVGAWRTVDDARAFPKENDGKELNAFARTCLQTVQSGAGCMFLVGGQCSVYESRPSVCRTCHAVDVDPSQCRDRVAGKASVPSGDTTPILWRYEMEAGKRDLPDYPKGELHAMWEELP